MRHRHLAIGLFAALAIAACSGGTGAGSSSAPATSPSNQASPSAPGSGAVQTIQVKLTDALKMDPPQITVKSGQPVKFVVTNTGATDHEFYLGDEAAQAAHGTEMKSMGGMMAHDEDNGIALKPGETKELTHTFASAGPSLAGCHVNAHYDSGMKATITVE